MSQKKYVSLNKLSIFLDNLQNIFAKKSEVDTSISEIKNGSTTVAKANEATHSETANSATLAVTATKAEKDGSGAIITATYETKSDASVKLAEAKAYADDLVSGLAASGSGTLIQLNILEEND